MKKVITSICLIFTLLVCKSQTGYFFAYGVNTSEKTVYFSYIEDVSNYTECKEQQYNTKLNPKECLLNSFRTSLKIEAGSTSYRYDLTAATKRNSSGYGTDEYFPNKNDAERNRKEIMANFSERDYKILKLNL